MPGLRLYKKEKLCSATAVSRLFERSGDVQSALAYPLRAVWRTDAGRRSDAPIAFVITVPKKRLRHAVDRVAMRRRIREAYRLARPRFPLADDTRLDVAFIYVADRLRPYASVEAAMNSLLSKISEKHGRPTQNQQ